MIIQIKSDNPNLSYMLAKNPDSGLQGEPLRKGFLFHYFITPQYYVIYFEDNCDSVNISYPKVDSKGEYLDRTSYISSHAMFDILSTLFRHCLKPKVDEKYLNYSNPEKGYTYSLECILEVQGEHNLDIFKKYCESDFGKVNFQYKKFHRHVYDIVLTSHDLFNLIKIAFIFAVYNSIYNKDEMYLHTSFVTKVVEILNVLDAPFFIRYLIKKNMIFNRKVYDTIKEKLQSSTRYKIKFVSQNSPWEIRYNYVYNHINTTVPVLIDWGFGEGKLLYRMRKMFDVVIGVEIDDAMLERLNWRIGNKADHKGIICIDAKDSSQLHKLEGLVKDKQCAIVLSEVIEHLETIHECKSFLSYLLDKYTPVQILITTPNREFNKYLSIDTLRHEDHKFELDKGQLINLISSVLEGRNYKFELKGIGDIVNEEPMWFGVNVFKDKE